MVASQLQTAVLSLDGPGGLEVWGPGGLEAGAWAWAWGLLPGVPWQ